LTDGKRAEKEEGEEESALIWSEKWEGE